MRWAPLLLLLFALVLPFQSQRPASPAVAAETVYGLKPARVVDGESAQLHESSSILVRGQKIETVGPAATLKAPADATVIDLPGLTIDARFDRSPFARAAPPLHGKAIYKQ